MFYSARSDGQQLTTGILTRPGWLDLHLRLGEGTENVALDPAVPDPPRPLPSFAAEAAMRRVAEALAVGTRVISAPLYRLLDVQVSADSFRGTSGSPRSPTTCFQLPEIGTKRRCVSYRGRPSRSRATRPRTWAWRMVRVSALWPITPTLELQNFAKVQSMPVRPRRCGPLARAESM
jgi:hypothetical protein